MRRIESIAFTPTDDPNSAFMKACFLLLPLLIASFIASAVEPAKLFTEYTPETFREMDRAKEDIDFTKIDDDLLSAAVFHETNRRRSQEKLSPLQYHVALRDAARMQSEIMAKRGSISHINPDLPEKKTPADRFRLAGLQPAFTAENVATAFGIEYMDGEQVYVREENGGKKFSREPDGQPIPMHSYVSFAEALLDAWMKSPGHRKNIVSTEPQYLAASCHPRMSDKGMPMFYCAQAFYTPLPSQPEILP
jgi:uncharacterized protein YkwD